MTTAAAGKGSFAAFACAAAFAAIFSFMLNITLGIFVVAVILVSVIGLLLSVLRSLCLIRWEPSVCTA